LTTDASSDSRRPPKPSTTHIGNHKLKPSTLMMGYGFEPVGRYEFLVGEQADEDIIMKKNL